MFGMGNKSNFATEVTEVTEEELNRGWTPMDADVPGQRVIKSAFISVHRRLFPRWLPRRPVFREASGLASFRRVFCIDGQNFPPGFWPSMGAEGYGIQETGHGGGTSCSLARGAHSGNCTGQGAILPRYLIICSVVHVVCTRRCGRIQQLFSARSDFTTEYTEGTEKKVGTLICANRR